MPFERRTKIVYGTNKCAVLTRSLGGSNSNQRNVYFVVLISLDLPVVRQKQKLPIHRVEITTQKGLDANMIDIQMPLSDERGTKALYWRETMKYT